MNPASDAEPATAASPPSTTGFPRSARLLNAADYKQVFNDHRRVSDQYWTVLVHRHQGMTGRLGLAIAKKRAKRAVDRNRLKRIVREAFRHNAQRLTGIDLVVMNRDSASGADNSTLRQSFEKLIHKAVKPR